MPRNAPKFWQEDGVLAKLLAPLSCLYVLGLRVKENLSKPYKSKLPVICIGGVVVGGSGKTPVLRAVLKTITEQGIYERPVILTRGYGGSLKGPTQVYLGIHTAKDVGDEAITHAAYAPVIVSANRAHGARLAEAMGADVILMDDGLQNTSLHKDISFLVVDSVQGMGNGRVLPAGPLREPYERARKKCAAVIETGGKNIADSLKTTLSITSNHNKDISYFGFAGLGNPEKFRQTLLQNGFKLAGFKAFPDHHAYTDSDIESLVYLAGRHRLITTEKDAVKISDTYKNQIDVLSIEISFDDPHKIMGLIKP